MKEGKGSASWKEVEEVKIESKRRRLTRRDPCSTRRKGFRPEDELGKVVDSVRRLRDHTRGSSAVEGKRLRPSRNELDSVLRSLDQRVSLDDKPILRARGQLEPSESDESQRDEGRFPRWARRKSWSRCWRTGIGGGRK